MKKSILLLFFIFFNLKSPAQIIKDSLLDQLLIEVQDLMTKNNLPQRKKQAISADSLKLSFLIEKRRAQYDAAFGAEKQLHHNTDNSLSLYINPKIKISQFLDSIIFKKKESSKLIYYKCLSIIAHEIVHYLQDVDTTYISIKNAKDLGEYITQPFEFPAYIIGAIFFLKNFDSTSLIEINKIKNTRKQRELLINKYYNIIHPKMDNIFKLTD